MADVKESETTKVTAWDELMKEDHDAINKRRFNSSYEIIQDFSDYASIQGIIYIFFTYQTWFGKLFWILVILLMLGLGIYWIVEAYISWQDKPVLTTITTTAYSVKQVDFPAVTICSPGMNEDILTAGFLKQFFAYLLLNRVNMTISPFRAARILSKNTTNMTTDEAAAYTMIESTLNSPHFLAFINTSFPGLLQGDDLPTLVKLLTSKNPDADVAAMVALEGGYNPCDNSTLLGSRTVSSNNTIKSPCDDGFVLDAANGYCYIALDGISGYGFTYKDVAMSDCSTRYGAELLRFESDAQVSGLMSLVSRGILVIPRGALNTTFLDAFRDSYGNFTFGSRVTTISTFKLLKLNALYSNMTQYCLMGRFDPKLNYTELRQADCRNDMYGAICRKVQKTTTSCTATSTFQKRDTLNFLLDPSLQAEKNKALKAKGDYFKDMFARLNQTAAYKALFSNLWYSTLPCFDIRGITAEREGDSSMLKYCEWKGKQISCASIFVTFPTDKGMCCSFNMKAADDIFQNNTYPQIVSELQKSDKISAFTDSQVPPDYEFNREPKTLPGRNKGLFLMLDAHSELFAAGSVDTDYLGFTGLISASQNFPYTAQEGFEIKPGHNNIIALSGTEIQADDTLRDLSVKSRNCLFPEENTNMKIYKNYTYSNCIFECSLMYAKDRLAQAYNNSRPCMPWFYPSTDKSVTICEPWAAVKFLEFMNGDIPNDVCSYCLPDCSTTIYEPMITTIPFRPCDESNLGVSRLCSLDNTKLPDPTIFSTQVLDEYEARNSPLPSFVQSNMDTSTRHYGKGLKPGGMVFTTMNRKYDAYEKDIAVVQIYFRKSSVMAIGSQPRLTWTDFMAVVGGLLGLVLGMGFISFIEIIWLCLRLCSRKCGLQWIVP